MPKLNEPIRPTPGIHYGETVRTRSVDLLLASLPLLGWSWWRSGARTLTVALLCVFFSVLWEAGYEWLLRRRFTVNDLSAAGEGVLLALLLPVTVPLWMLPLGTGFGILLCKCLPGGIGRQIVSPSLGGAALLMLLFPEQMVTFAAPDTFPPAFSLAPAGEIHGSLLTRMWTEALPRGVSGTDLLVGDLPGVIGALAPVLLVLVFLWLLLRRLAHTEQTLFFLLPVVLVSLLLPPDGLASDAMLIRYALFQLCSGPMLLIAILHYADPTCAPSSTRGRALLALLAGIVTVLLRRYSVFEEGAVFGAALAQAGYSAYLFLKYRPKAGKGSRV